MSLVNGYCSLPELQGHLKDDGARLDGALLERAINAASRAVDKHCGRRFWQDSGTADRTYVAEHPDYVFVDDISTRTGVVVKTGTDGAAFPVTLTVNVDYVLEPRNADKFASASFDAYAFWQIRRIAGTFTVDLARPTISVTARHGWSAVPEEVKQATILKAAAIFKRKDAVFGVAGFSEFGAVRITRSDPDVLDLLAAYELPGFA